MKKEPPVTHLPAAPAHGVGVKITANGRNSSSSSTEVEGRAALLDERGAESMHIAIITQMVMDLKSQCRKKDSARLRKEAEAWFKSRDFILTCELAGLEPGWVMRKIDEAEKRGFEGRLPVGKGWRTKGREGQ